MIELMSQQPPTSRVCTQVSIYWVHADPYEQVMGVEYQRHVRGHGLSLRRADPALLRLGHLLCLLGT
jgi:hypothetical protein